MKFILKLSLMTLLVTLGNLSTKTSSANTQAECSPQDLRAIKKFDRKAKNVREKIAEISEEARRNRDPDDIENSVEDIDRENEFFDSPAYEAMKPVYERCGREIPTMHTGYQPFWMPTN